MNHPLHRNIRIKGARTTLHGQLNGTPRRSQAIPTKDRLQSIETWELPRHSRVTLIRDSHQPLELEGPCSMTRVLSQCMTQAR